MKTRLFAFALVGACAAAVIAAQPAQPDKAKTPADATQPATPGQPSMDAETQAWMTASMPNENHAQLSVFVGTWDAKTSFKMDPSAPPMEGTGTMVNEWVLGGRWIKHTFHGDFMGMPFEGLGYFGYDNIKKTFVGTWTDSMSTSMMLSKGAYDAKAKTYTMLGEFDDPMGRHFKSREVVTVLGPDSHTMTFYHTGADGKEMHVGDITYTRAKAEKPMKAGQ